MSHAVPIGDAADVVVAAVRWAELADQFDAESTLDTILTLSRDEMIALVLVGLSMTKGLAEASR